MTPFMTLIFPSSSSSSSSSSSPLALYSAGLLGLVSFATYASYSLLTYWSLRKRRWDALKEELERKETEVNGLKEGSDRREVELMKLRSQLKAVEEDKKEREDALNGLREEAERKANEARDWNVMLEERLKKVTEELALMNQEKEKLAGVHAQAVRSSENGTHLLTRTDQYADNDVVQMIEAVNSVILQTARRMAEEFSPQLRRDESIETNEARESEDLKNAVEHTEEILGLEMTRMLHDFNHQDDTALLQIAFQASMCAFAEWIIGSWLFHARDDELILQEVYERLREAEEHTVSGRWRILTRKYVRELFPEGQDLPCHFFAAFANILIVAGVRNSQELVQETLRSLFSEKIDIVVKDCVHLNNVIGDNITSRELLPVYCSPEIPFDSSAMDGTFGDASSTSPATSHTESERLILCSTDLGLLRAEKIPGKVGEWTNVMLLKPKVVLESGLRLPTKPA